MTEQAPSPAELAWTEDVERLARQVLEHATAKGQSQGATANQATVATVLAGLRLAVAHGHTAFEASALVRQVLVSWDRAHGLRPTLRSV